MTASSFSPSLKKKIVITITGMTILIWSLAIGVFLITKDLSDTHEHVVHEFREEIMPIAQIGSMMTELSTNMNNYVLIGDKESIRSISRWSKEIDVVFDEVLSVEFGSNRHKDKIVKAKVLWGQVRESHARLGKIKKPVGSREAREEVELAHSLIGDIRASLRDANSHGLKEINEGKEKALAIKDRNDLFLALILPLSIAIMVGTGLVINRSILEPLKALGEVVQRIGDGDYSGTVVRPTQDEVGQLSRTFNRMAKSIDSYNAQLHELAIHDRLTKVLNRHEFHKRLEAQIEETAQSRASFSLLMLDIDHFKKVNDKYGHMIGDKALTEIAAVLRESVRSIDIVARYGGEEFVVILPGATRENTFEAAERIRRLIEEHEIEINVGQTIRVTISIGVARHPNDARTGDELVKKADQALYRAKGCGRNCVQACGTSQQEIEIIA